VRSEEAGATRDEDSSLEMHTGHETRPLLRIGLTEGSQSWKWN
jgi:hypothetical protein